LCSAEQTTKNKEITVKVFIPKNILKLTNAFYTKTEVGLFVQADLTLDCNIFTRISQRVNDERFVCPILKHFRYAQIKIALININKGGSIRQNFNALCAH
jgi:hypothetical protein